MKNKKSLFTLLGVTLFSTVLYLGISESNAQMPSGCEYSSGDLCCKEGEPPCAAISNAKPKEAITE